LASHEPPQEASLFEGPGLDIDKLARLTRINLSGEEKAVIAKSLDRLITYFDDILQAQPDVNHSADNQSFGSELIADRPTENVDFLFDHEQIVERDGGRYFLIPRVIE
jgi:Asp-tRNA(Asn)/Glu-tRNA(Gln) amidotransferase C subunit